MSRLVNIAVEGLSDLGVARRLVRAVGLVPTDTPYVLNGKGNLDKRVPAFCKAAARSAWFILRDLDREPCAGYVVARLAPHRPPGLCLRVAIHSVESWLLADRSRIAAFLHVAADLVPANPDQELDPKRILVGLAARSRRREIRKDMAPRAGSTAPVGPSYTARVGEFAENHWNPRAAATVSPSLGRCLRALAKLKQR